MDTISCGATIAWAMDAFEHGLLTEADTGGLELRFGDAAVMVQLTEMIAKREGLGDLLAEGSARAAARIGRGSEDLVVAVKGQELPAHMPQVKRSLALIYAVNPFGADHQSHEHDPSWKDYPARMAEIGVTDEPQPNKVLNEAKVQLRPEDAVRLLLPGLGQRLPVRLRAGLAPVRHGASWRRWSRPSPAGR